MNQLSIPAEPFEGIEHDFRQTPTRISARRIGAPWVVYERRQIGPIGADHLLAFRGDWSDAFLFATRMVSLLDGRTVLQAQADGDLEV